MLEVKTAKLRARDCTASKRATHRNALVTGVPSNDGGTGTPRIQSAVAAVSQVDTGAIIVKSFRTSLPQAIHGIFMSSGDELP